PPPPGRAPLPCISWTTSGPPCPGAHGGGPGIPCAAPAVPPSAATDDAIAMTTPATRQWRRTAVADFTLLPPGTVHQSMDAREYNVVAARGVPHTRASPVTEVTRRRSTRPRARRVVRERRRALRDEQTRMLRRSRFRHRRPHRRIATRRA